MRIIETNKGYLKEFQKGKPEFTNKKNDAASFTPGLAKQCLGRLRNKGFTAKIRTNGRVKKVGKIKYYLLKPEEKKTYIAALKQTEKTLKKHSYRMFLVYGGLLAGMREKDLIPHDKDIDVAVFAKSASNDYASLKKEIAEIATLFPHVKRIGQRSKEDWGGLRFTAYINEAEKEMERLYVDIYLAFKDPLNPKHYAISNFYPRDYKIDGKTVTRYYTSLPKGWINQLRRAGELQKNKFLVPKQAETCLEVWYDNWKIPVRTPYFTTSRLINIKANEQYVVKGKK